MLKPDSRNEAQHLTDDEGIIKIPIKTLQDAPSVAWHRGMNAKFHYTAHAYLVPQTKEESCANPHECKEESHSHSDHHKHHTQCGCNSEEARQKKLELIQNLLAGNLPKQNSTEQPSPLALDPSAKPVRTLISDSRKNDENPFELRIGYSFSVQAMEICIKSMKLGERARFLCMPKYVEGFIQLETLMRQEKLNRTLKAQGKPPLSMSGCSAHISPEMMQLSQDLDVAIGVPLEFEFELLAVQEPNSFTREPWEMSSEEQYREVPIRKAEGGQLYKQGNYEGSLKKYERCLVLLETLASSGIVMDLKKEEMDQKRGIHTESIIPKDNIIQLRQIEEWTIACRLNYAACKLKLGDHRAVIIQCTQVLTMEPQNVKALFRRGQSYMLMGRDLDLAHKDFEALTAI
ncbi:hypothetical protein HDU91_004320, partial [Kappamyces sp. JEL0680]